VYTAYYVNQILKFRWNSNGFQWKKDGPHAGRQSQIYKILSIGKSTYDARLKYLEIDQSN
jgi:hypothetical protein